jgi:hypothetical protein
MHHWTPPVWTHAGTITFWRGRLLRCSGQPMTVLVVERRQEARTSPFQFREQGFSRLNGILSLALLGFMALSLFLYLRGRSRDESVDRPRADVPAPAAPVPPSDERPPAIAAVPVRPADPAAVPRPGRVLGRVIFPNVDRGRRNFSYQIYVFSADGTMDGPRPVANSDRFELGPLAPGRKAVLFFSPSEFLTCPYQVLVVPEGGDCEVVLRPTACHALEGKVVGANGTPVGGVYVTATETVPLPRELYLEGRPASVVGLDITVSSSGVTSPVGANPSEIPVGILKISPLEGLVSRGAITDAQGRFAVPVSTADVAVPLAVSRVPGEVLKEEVVIPKSGFARIIVPSP